MSHVNNKLKYSLDYLLVIYYLNIFNIICVEIQFYFLSSSDKSMKILKFISYTYIWDLSGKLIIVWYQLSPSLRLIFFAAFSYPHANIFYNDHKTLDLLIPTYGLYK